MPGSLRTTALLCGLGIAFDVAVNQQAPGASFPLFVTLLIATMLASLPRSVERSVLCALAVVFASFIAFRDDEGLIVADVLATGSLLGVAATGSGVLVIGVRTAVRRVGALLRAGLAAPARLAAPVIAPFAGAHLGKARPALRAVVIALPVLAVFVALLGSADAVFASVVRIRWPHVRLGSVAGHLTLTIIGTLVCATLWFAAERPTRHERLESSQRALLGPAEWMTVLSGMTVLFAVFVTVQFAYLFGGAHRVQVTPGLTYAQYARSGFFQLLFAAGLTAAVVVAAWDLGRKDSPRDRRIFRGLVSAVLFLCVVMLASAWKRLGLYQDAFGWTLTRFVAGLAIIWIGAVLVVVAAALWTERRRHVVAAAAGAGLALLIAANILAPSAFVAARNVERFNATGKLDVPYLFLLGTDAVPAIAQVLPRLPADPDIIGALCELNERLSQHGWRSWNLARIRAAAAVTRLPDCRRMPGAGPLRSRAAPRI